MAGVQLYHFTIVQVVVLYKICITVYAGVVLYWEGLTLQKIEGSCY